MNETLSQIALLVFVISSKYSLGISLTMKQIIDPLKKTRMVILALVANFVLVPILAYLLAIIFNLDDSLRTGLILLSTGAGAPFPPKLVVAGQNFNSDVLTYLLVIAIISLVILMPIYCELGKRMKAPAEAEQPSS